MLTILTLRRTHEGQNCLFRAKQKPYKRLNTAICRTLKRGGAEGSRTPVRKPVLTTFSGCSLSFKSPSHERRQTGSRVWQPLVHQRLQGNSSVTFTTRRRHIPARGTAEYDGSALRQLLTQNYYLRLNLKVRRLK